MSVDAAILLGCGAFFAGWLIRGAFERLLRPLARCAARLPGADLRCRLCQGHAGECAFVPDVERSK